MGRSKDLSIQMHEELWATVDMPFELYKSLKSDEMKLVKVKDKLMDYSSNKEWREADKTLKEAIRYRREIEEGIRAEKLSKCD